MALNSTTFKVQYTANGSTSDFSFPYLFLDETHLVVVETNTTTGVDTVKTLTTHYTVTGAGLSAGGTVHFLVNPSNGIRVTIYREVPLTQLTDYNQSDSFPAETHETALDKQMMVAQQQSGTGGTVDRSIKYKSTEPSGFVSTLPDIVDRKGKVIGFNASTGAMEVQDPTDFTINPGDIALTDIEDIATDTLIGRATAGTGSPETIALTAAGRALIDDADSTAQRVTLGLVIGTNVQAYDAELAALAGLTSAADKVPYFTGSGTATVADLTAAGRALLDDATATVQRATLEIAGKETVWIPSSAMISRTTSGAASGTTESTTNKVMLLTLDFDAAADEFAQFHVRMPKSWNESTVTAIPIWTAASGSGDVVWGVQAVALSNDDAVDTAYGTAQTSTDTLITASDIHVAPETSAITIAGTPAVGDWVSFQVYRDANDGGDTLAVDASLIGVVLIYSTDETKDD